MARPLSEGFVRREEARRRQDAGRKAVESIGNAVQGVGRTVAAPAGRAWKAPVVQRAAAPASSARGRAEAAAAKKAAERKVQVERAAVKKREAERVALQVGVLLQGLLRVRKPDGLGGAMGNVLQGPRGYGRRELTGWGEAAAAGVQSASGVAGGGGVRERLGGGLGAASRAPAGREGGGLAGLRSVDASGGFDPVALLRGLSGSSEDGGVRRGRSVGQGPVPARVFSDVPSSSAGWQRVLGGAGGAAEGLQGLGGVDELRDTEESLRLLGVEP